MTARYKLKKEIVHPMGSVAAGTESIIHGDYHVFPYIGNSYDKGSNGWLGNGLMLQYPSSYPDFFEEIKEPESIKVEDMWRLIPADKADTRIVVKSSKPIPEDKFPSIKAAIESVINDEPVSPSYPSVEDINKMFLSVWDKCVDHCLRIIDSRKPLREPFELLSEIYNLINEMKSAYGSSLYAPQLSSSFKFDTEWNCPPMKPNIKPINHEQR